MLVAGGVFGLYTAAPYSNWHDKLTAIAGIVVFAWGMIGLVATGLALGPAVVANDRRCLAIQRDMLAAQPRRADGPDLFEALGCRPQGEGSVFAKPTKAEQASENALPIGKHQ